MGTGSGSKSATVSTGASSFSYSWDLQVQDGSFRIVTTWNQTSGAWAANLALVTKPDNNVVRNAAWASSSTFGPYAIGGNTSVEVTVAGNDFGFIQFPETTVVSLSTPECPDRTYSFPLYGNDILGSRYRVIWEKSDGTSGTIFDGTVAYGKTQTVSGMLANFCGDIFVYQLDRAAADPDNAWVLKTTIPQAPVPPAVPSGPSAKPPQTPKPDVPSAPPVSPSPAPAGPAPTPDSENDSDESVLWQRQIGDIAKKQLESTTISNQHLQNISTQSNYQSDRLKEIAERVTSIDERDEMQELAQQQAQAISPSPADMSTAGSVAADQAASNIPKLGNRSSSSYVVTTSAPDFTFAFYGNTFNLDPFAPGRFGAIADWFRAAMAWVVTIAFGIWAAKETSAFIQSAAAARQAQGNAIVGGTGAQATAFAAATLITVVFLALLVALVAWSSYDLGAGSVLSMFTVNPYSGMAGGAAYLLDRFFPIGLMAACFVMRISWSLTLQGAYVVYASIVRFIVP